MGSKASVSANEVLMKLIKGHVVGEVKRQFLMYAMYICLITVSNMVDCKDLVNRIRQRNATILTDSSFAVLQSEINCWNKCLADFGKAAKNGNMVCVCFNKAQVTESSVVTDNNRTRFNVYDLSVLLSELHFLLLTNLLALIFLSPHAGYHF